MRCLLKRFSNLLAQAFVFAAPVASLLIAAVISTPASAQIRIPSYTNLCSYEPACSKVLGKVKKGEAIEAMQVFVTNRNRQMPVKIPNITLMKYYAHLRSTIIQVAAEYQIDAVTLVLTPLAENTMNVHIDDKIGDDLVNLGLAFGVSGEGDVAGYKLSVGPGQIYTSAAKHVEKLAAAIENRPVRKGKEITQALMTPDGALRYAAAIIRDAQEVYAAGGHDISRRPEILATLYNIGKVKERLAGARDREPYPNYFGYWVALNYDTVQRALKLPSLVPGH